MSRNETDRAGGGVTLGALLAASGLDVVCAQGPLDVPVTSLVDDSRSITPGSCFVAVRGRCTDGHAYVADALRAGAFAVVVEHGADLHVPARATVLRVSDTRAALARLAAAFHGVMPGGPRGLRLIGVTGTNGKTTTTWLVRSILQRAGLATALIGTVEYDLCGRRVAAPLTTPGAIALCAMLGEAADAGARAAVLEVSSHALDQRRTDGLSFSVGVLTNLSGDHLDYHRTMDEYRTAKRRLFQGLDADAAGVMNADDPASAEMAAATRARVVTYGLANPMAEVRAEVERLDRDGSAFLLHLCGSAPHSRAARVRLPLVGRHNVMNALAAAAACAALGVDTEAIVAGLEHAEAVPGRLERVEPAGWPFTVMVDYAHTDDALANVLSAVRALTDRRVVCVFGCGGDRDRTKRPRMAAVVERLADVAYVTSDNPRSENPQAIIADIVGGFSGAERCRVEVACDRASAIAAALGEAEAGDVVLIAGKGHETYQLIGGRTLHFDDREVARACLAGRAAPRHDRPREPVA
jgi:UDP-N-acetylmuramoyl-L-alanyl-D-glutamate--2,6-diaminopimelate ligase